MRIPAILLPLTLLAACASGPQDAGIDPTLFDHPTPVVGKDARGVAVVVFPTDDLPNWVEVTRDGTSHLAWTPRLGHRLAALVPVSAFSPRPSDTVVALPAPRPLGVGLGEGDRVEWSGTPYVGPVAILPWSLDLRTPRFVAAVAQVSPDGAVLDVHGELPSRYLVVPQPSDGRKCRMATPDDFALDATCRKAAMPNPPNGATRFHAEPTLSAAGATLAAWKVPASEDQDALTPTYAVGVLGGRTYNHVGLQTLREPLTTLDPTAVSELARGVWSLADGQPLIAAYYLDGATTDWPIYEAFAAGGRGAWSQLLITRGNGLMTEDLLALAQVALVEGRVTEARQFADAAFEEALRLAQPGQGMLRGHAAAINAEAASREGQYELAAQWARRGAEAYAAAGDELRVADAQVDTARHLLQANRAEDAATALDDARSRYFYAGSVWHSALAEQRLGQVYARAGRAEDATRMLTYAGERFTDLGDGLAAGRVRINAAAQQGNLVEVRAYLDAALASADTLGTAEAATTLTLNRISPHDAATVIGGLASVQDAYADPVLDARIQMSWKELCISSPQSVAQVAPERCGVVAADAPAASAEKALADAFEKLRSGDVDGARALRAAALPSLDPTLEYRLGLLDACLAVRDHTEADLAIQPLVQRLESATAPGLVGRGLAQLADEAARWSQVEIAAALLGAAMQAATRTGQFDERTTYGVARVELLHAAGVFNEAIVVADVTQRALAAGGPRNATVAFRVAALRYDAARRLGQNTAPPDTASLPEGDRRAAQETLATLAYHRHDFDEMNATAAFADDALRLEALAAKDLAAASREAASLAAGGKAPLSVVALATEGCDAATFVALETGYPAFAGWFAIRRGNGNANDDDACVAALGAIQSGQRHAASTCDRTGRGAALAALHGRIFTDDRYGRQTKTIAALQPTPVAFDSAKLTRLEDAVSNARPKGGAGLQRAFIEWISYEIAAGKPGDALKHMDEAGSMLLEIVPTAAADLTGLRLVALAATRQWNEAFQLALRAMSETPVQDEAGAQLALRAAQVALTVGARELAREWLSTAAAAAKRNPKLVRHIQETANLHLLGIQP